MKEPEGTTSCRMQGESVRPYVGTYVHPPFSPSLPQALQRLAHASWRLAKPSKRTELGDLALRPASEGLQARGAG